jgi:hypothetical protein
MALPSDENTDFYVCDAVRQTADGKLDIAGFYPTTEVKLDPAARLPVTVNLTFVWIMRDGEGQYRPTLRIVDPLGNELHKFDLPEARKPAGAAHIFMLPVGQIPIAHAGNYVVSLEINGQPYRRSVRIFQ